MIKIIVSVVFLGFQISPLLSMHESMQDLSEQELRIKEGLDGCTVKRLSFTEADVKFCDSLKRAISTLELKQVERVFRDESESTADIKKALNIVLDAQGNTMLPFAVSVGCGLDILKLLRSKGAGFNGIDHKNPTLEIAIFNDGYSEKECKAIVAWLVQEDAHVPTVKFNRPSDQENDRVGAFVQRMGQKAREAFKTGCGSDEEDALTRRCEASNKIPELFKEKQVIQVYFD